ncbi:MAG: hypothetical protein AAFP85_09835 [Pseudomonadota bacterium]
MGDGGNSITGRWTGRYDYSGKAAPVPFDAALEDNAGILSGEVTEPNTFRRDMGAHLAALLLGERTGFDVSFRKTYDGFDQGDDPVYEGALNTALTRIDGFWRFPNDPHWSGRFMMVRAVDMRARRKVAAAADA